jgi:hypothetical protein
MPILVAVIFAVAIYLLIAQSYGLWPMGSIFAVSSSNP